ncbi:MAG: acetaldehyde dehydrogenase (acetylating) [Firmicutes bacterium]|nr:acetaldehyde dehydrogenase (acetylating) [Bacillota bacterium]
MYLDYDLSSIQEARVLARKAKQAQLTLENYSEEEIDKILVAMVKAVEDNAEWLARMAVDETKYGVFEHKVIKNLFASREIYNSTKDIKTIGVIKEDQDQKVVEVAVPMGVIMGIVPTTNPTSTIIHNTLCSVKGANTIVFSPHPNAVKCSNAAVQLLHDAAVNAGAPEGLVGCVTKTSMKATEELMHHDDISVIVATGGSAMVKAAYSAGKPAFGVGPGNVPAFIERTADIKQAVTDIVTSKTFDNGMICASEQAILADEPIKEEIITELKSQGCYFLNPEETEKVAKTVLTPRGGLNPAMVGKSPKFIAEKAGITIPAETCLLVAPLDGHGTDHPLAHEKLSPVLGFYTVKDWKEACHLSIELLNLGGIGHSFSIHSQNEEVIREFIRKPVFRILVNTPSALGGIGYTTGLTPSMTLGCGTWGGSSISENLGPQHLINIKRLAYGIKKADTKVSENKSCDPSFSSDDIASIVKKVLHQLQKAQ